MLFAMFQWIYLNLGTNAKTVELKTFFIDICDEAYSSTSV